MLSRGLLTVGALLGALAGTLPAAAAAQDELPLAQSHLREFALTLPPGVAVSPAAADGLVACSDDLLRLGTTAPAACPDAAKVGSVEITSPPIPGILTGAIYVRPSTPDQLIRIALTASSERGVHIKLPGEIQLDPQTGQVTASFVALPQLPFSTLKVRFKGGARAMLANPIECGSYTTRSVLTPWSGTAPVVAQSLFQVGDGNCAGALPFDPAVQAGSTEPVAGAFSPFVFRIQRQDGRQELERLRLKLPKGMSAKLAGVPRCATAAAASGACPPESRVGAVTVGAGAGPSPLYLSGGQVFLTDGYGGGPFGLAIVVRALAGPFDLGTVVVRAAVLVDPDTVQLTIVSDPLPRILRGVPLRLRDLHLAIDRPGFMVNPTDCRRTQVQTTIGAVQGGTSSPAVPYQVGDCADLGFKPRFSVALLGRGQTTDGKRPALRVQVRSRRGNANLRTVTFTLPPHIAFDATRGGPGMCRLEQLAKDACPRRSRVGTARASSPLLSGQLRGPVYFIRGVRGDVFPKLGLRLDGDLRIDLLGSTAVTRAGLRTSFRTLPDVPLSAFTMRLAPGLLTPTKNVCARRPVSVLTMRGQNGRRVDRRVRVGVPCPRRR